MCLSVPSVGDQNRVDWRLLVKERIVKIEKLGTPVLAGFNDFLEFDYFFGVLSLANQPTLHSGGASRGRVCGCCCWYRGQVICDR